MTPTHGPLSVGEDGAGIWEEVSEGRPRHEVRVASLPLKAFLRDEDQRAPLPLEVARARRLALAALFVAAPELAEALGMLVAHLELVDSEMVDIGEVAREDIETARAALAKAGK